MCFLLLHAITCHFTVLYYIRQNYGGILVKNIYNNWKKSENLLEKILKRFTFGRGGGVLKSEPPVHFFTLYFFETFPNAKLTLLFLVVCYMNNVVL